jgi:hypothetical protein
MPNCDFVKRLTTFLKITFFKSHILKLLFLNRTFLKSQTQTDLKYWEWYKKLHNKFSSNYMINKIIAGDCVYLI